MNAVGQTLTVGKHVVDMRLQRLRERA
jgi:hypothetical protein